MLLLSALIFALGVIAVLAGMRGKSPMMFLIPVGIVVVILGLVGFGMYLAGVR